MSNTSEIKLVYLVVRYGSVIGAYFKQEDAMQVVSASINKGHVCDLIIKPVL